MIAVVSRAIPSSARQYGCDEVAWRREVDRVLGGSAGALDLKRWQMGRAGRRGCLMICCGVWEALRQSRWRNDGQKGLWQSVGAGVERQARYVGRGAGADAGGSWPPETTFTIACLLAMAT